MYRKRLITGRVVVSRNRGVNALVPEITEGV